ncbi:O-antigen ligase family protein [Solibacillus sp. CAU 1738]|uniref:O-antigen ligase family protein n=1 Tax=Solibacillus sp. CAU 1738 TaxID=3140363 RepID=UPI00326037E6
MASFYEELHKSDAFSDEKENAQSRASIDKWIFRLLLILIGFMPLIVVANVEQVVSPLISNIDALSSGTKGDLFTHFKALFVLGITVITGGMLLAKVFFMGGTIRKTALNYFLGLFVIAIVLSTIFSPNISIALSGQYNRADGAISWLCYVALMFIAMNISYPKNTIRYIMYAMMPFVFINLYIITMNFYGKDLLQNAAVQKFVSMLLPEGASISQGSHLVGTLNQWNYMSGMFAIMTVMYLAWAIISKNWGETIVGAITASASVAIMFMSISTSGFLTVVISLIVVLIIFIKAPMKKNAFVAIMLFLVTTVPIFHILASKNDLVWKESFGFMFDSNPYEETSSQTTLNHFGNFGLKQAYAADQTFELPVLPEKGWSLGSGRMYIWDKTLDLVADRPILGYGLDSIVYNFPHYNIDARSGNNSENTIVDKPHNLYIGILYGTGVIGALALLLILLSTAFTGAKAFVDKKKLQMTVLFIGVFAFGVQALFNDSLPGVTPIVFVFMGILISLIENKKMQESI